MKWLMEKILNGNKLKPIKIEEQMNLPLNIQYNALNELLRNKIELTDLPDAFQLLLSKDEEIKLKAAEVINKVMISLNSSTLIRMDKIFRERTSYEWYYDWNNKDPKELLHPLMSEEEKISILGLATFHPNGFFREKALIVLSDMETGAEIPYILIRINDWVRQVRNTSNEKLQRYLKSEYAMSFVNNLPLVLRLKECSRDEYNDIINEVVSVLSSAGGSQKLICGLQSKDAKVRLACYKIILKTKVIDNRSIIKYLIKDNNPYNRIFVLRNIQQDITKDEFTDISQLLLTDKFAQIRKFALETLYKFKLEDYINILEASLFDKNQSVRDLARYLLAKQKKYDFAVIYREAIQKNEKLYSSICGLGETGDIKDSEIISEFLHSKVVKIVKASINALGRLDIHGYKDVIILSLNDERAGISKTARRVLYEEIDVSDADALYNIFKQAIYEYVKINACVLLCSLSKWNSIRYIIEFCADENESIRAIGQYSFEGWIQKYNKTFNTPTKKQVEEIREAFKEFGKAIKKNYRDFIEFSIKDFIGKI
jgi:HEAT repeat protein